MKIFITTVLMFGALFVTAQEEADLSKRSEIKVNALYLILGGFELDYEYILNEESSIGLSATVFFDDNVDYNWGITPHYRLFFGNNPALGFFVEGHASIFNAESYDDFLTGENKSTAAGVGIAVGGKFKTKRDVVVEVVGGLGRIFSDSTFDTAYPRFGINIGKRF